MITKYLAIFDKEWRLLWRDKVGLIFLFLLPMCLVLFITLTSSVSEDKPRQFKLLLINQDPNGNISDGIVKALDEIKNFKIEQGIHKKPLTFDHAEKEVAEGNYQAVIIIPPQFSQQINNKLQQQVQPNLPANVGSQINNIQIYFDPALPRTFQDQVTASLEVISQSIELQLWRQMTNKLSSRPNNNNKNNNNANFIKFNTDYVKGVKGQTIATPNEVQQNVPAWALFGMFFILTPLSGMLVRERRLGMMERLRLAPVSLYTIIWGKITAFVCVNLLQLVLMLMVGVFVLPWFGFPALNVTNHIIPLLAIGVVSSLSATGFGMLIGSLVRTSEQANVIGPFIIVILAAVGGVLVPSYLLPEGFKQVTQYSPMSWALQAFIDVFVRNASVADILLAIGKLLLFSVVSISVATLILGRYRR
jgi:ABC-2 type transport system permease protein